VLTGKYLPGQPPPQDSRAAHGDPKTNTMQLFMNDELLTAVQQIGEVAERAGCTTAQLAIAWVLRNDNVASCIVGATRPEQLEDNVGALDVDLSDELVAEAEALLAPHVLDDPSLTEAFAPKERP
jgi:aryl-alcohol dehydrogenase-like predicted oxidoreductase